LARVEIDITNLRPMKGKFATLSILHSHAKLKRMADKFTVGLVQMRCTTASADENLARAIEKIREASARGAQIISLHELFRGEYFCRKEDAELFDLA
jgi:hypothetical protein